MGHEFEEVCVSLLHPLSLCSLSHRLPNSVQANGFIHRREDSLLVLIVSGHRLA